jgi:hypothetical protein
MGWPIADPAGSAPAAQSVRAPAPKPEAKAEPASTPAEPASPGTPESS